MSIASFSVRQTVLVNVLFFVCLLGGFGAYRLIPVEFFHDVTLNEVVVNTVWTGASADEVERLVTAKLEDELRSVVEIDRITSSSQADLSDINIEFDETLDDDAYRAAVSDVRAALDRVNDLPSDAEEPFLIEIETGSFGATMVAVIDRGGVGEVAVREVALDLVSRIRDAPGVGQVFIRALRDGEVRVLVDRDRAARHDLTVLEVADRIRRQNLNLPAGTFQDGSTEAVLRATGDYKSLAEILDTVIDTHDGGTELRLRDVARVERGLDKRRYLTRYDGYPALVINVGKEDDADVGQVVAAIDETLERHRALLPDGIDLRQTMNTAEFVKPRIDVLVNNLWAGAGLVLVLLWISIGFRNALLTIIAIPFSFLTAMIFFPLLDISINGTTLVAMLLVSGMLVDDAIIVLENIYRRIEEGEPLREAVVNGTNEVMWPVITAVSTTIAAFTPLLLVEGTAGKFVSVLPKAVVICLAASLFECLVILPAHYLDFGSRGRSEKRGRFGAAALGTRVRSVIDGGFERIRRGYAVALDVVLEHPRSFSVLTAALVFLGIGGAYRLPIVMFPSEYSNLNLMLDAPPDYSLDMTDAIAQRMDAELASLPDTDLLDFSTIVGNSMDSNYDDLNAPNLGMTFLTMPQTEENTLRPERVLEVVTERMAAVRAEFPPGVADIRVEARRNGPPVGRPVEIEIRGQDYARNKAISREVAAYLESLPGVSNVNDNLKEGPLEVRVKLDPERAGQHGVTFEDVARALRAANDGLIASSFRDPSSIEDEDIRVMLDSKYRDRRSDLLDVELRTDRGYLVRLGDVATLDVQRGYLSYRRVDVKRAVTVFADVDEELATSIGTNEKARAHFADLAIRYPDVEVVYGGEYQATGEALANTFAVFPAAFLLIYMMLAALFRSYLQPLIVIASVPLGLCGLVFGVAALGYNVSFILLYSTIGLMGVVVNDALVLVDFANKARERGLPTGEAVRLAGARRLRPVILTTLTTVLALLPMALGLQGSSKTYGPFAASIAFGLLFAMFGTLFVIPLAYQTLARLQDWGQGLVGRTAPVPAGGHAPGLSRGAGGGGGA